MYGYPPNRNRPITGAGEVGLIVRDLMKVRDLEQIDSNFLYLPGGKTGSGTTSPEIPCTAIFALPANQYTVVTLMGTTETDPMNHLVVAISARQPNGIPFPLPMGPRDAIAGETYYNWYIDSGDLKVRIWNGLEALEARIWYF